MVNLTKTARAAVRLVLRPGDVAIDATCGNGHDTRFLAEIVGPDGYVFAFDIQQTALQRTAEELLEFKNVSYEFCDHAEVRTLAAHSFNEPTAVMFNLGYLPGGDNSVVTRTEPTLRALTGSLEMLRAGGVLTVIAYPAHPGGAEETTAVADFFAQLDPAEFRVDETLGNTADPVSPRLFVVRKL